MERQGVMMIMMMVVMTLVVMMVIMIRVILRYMVVVVVVVISNISTGGFFSKIRMKSYLIFVIFFTLAKFLENKIYTEKRQFFALNL